MSEEVKAAIREMAQAMDEDPSVKQDLVAIRQQMLEERAKQKESAIPFC